MLTTRPDSNNIVWYLAILARQMMSNIFLFHVTELQNLFPWLRKNLSDIFICFFKAIFFILGIRYFVQDKNLKANANENITYSTFKFQPRSKKDYKMIQLRNDHTVQPLLLFHQWNLLWRKHSITWKSYLTDICQNAWCQKWVIPHKTSQRHEMV